MSKINLDKKLSDFELLTKLHSERKDYYSNNSYTPVKQQAPEKELHENINLSFIKPKINLDKKLSDFELLTKLNSERKNYYSDDLYKPMKKPSEKELVEDIDLSFMKPIIKFLFYFLLVFVGMPLFVSWNISVLLGTPMDAPFQAIKITFNFISSITAEQFVFGFMMFLGSFFMVGPFVLLFSCNCPKSKDD